jgi:hypothetical protein
MLIVHGVEFEAVRAESAFDEVTDFLLQHVHRREGISVEDSDVLAGQNAKMVT